VWQIFLRYAHSCNEKRAATQESMTLLAFFFKIFPMSNRWPGRSIPIKLINCFLWEYSEENAYIMEEFTIMKGKKTKENYFLGKADYHTLIFLVPSHINSENYLWHRNGDLKHIRKNSS